MSRDPRSDSRTRHSTRTITLVASHHSTLYPQCSFFEDALSGCWLESASADRSAGVLGVIVLLEEGAQGVLDLMSYFYPTLKLELSAENWLDVMASADKFHAPGLVGLCRDFARLRIQAQPLQTLHIGLEFRRSSLFFGSVAAIIDNFPAYQSEELWLCLPSDIISWVSVEFSSTSTSGAHSSTDSSSQIQGLHDAWQIRCMGTPTSSQLPLNSRRPHPSVIYMAWLQSDLKIGDNQPAVPRIKRIGQLVGESTIYSRPNDFWRKSNPAYLEVFAVSVSFSRARFCRYF